MDTHANLARTAPTITRILAHNLLKKAEEARLAPLARSGDAQAIDTLVQCNARFAYLLALRACRGDVGHAYLDDMFSAALRGLRLAAERFDPTKADVRFVAYARFYIRQQMQEETRRLRLGVSSISAGAAMLLFKIRAFQAGFEADHGRAPEPREIAEALEVDVGKVIRLLDVASARSMDASLSPDDPDGLSLHSFVVEPAPDPANAAEVGDRLQQLKEAIEELDERTQLILRHRFGLGGGAPMTLDELGAKMGVSRERIRQIEARALRALRLRTQRSTDRLRELAA